MTTHSHTVIRGMGVWNALGSSVTDCWQALQAGHTGVAPLSDAWLSGYLLSKTEQFEVGYVPEFNTDSLFSEWEKQRFDSRVRAVLTVIRDAVTALPKDELARSRVAVVVGTAVGMRAPYKRLMEGLKVYQTGNLSELPRPHHYASFVMENLPDTIFHAVAHDLGVTLCESMVLSNICASGSTTIAHGHELIVQNRVDVAICIGFDFFHPRQNRVFGDLQLLSQTPCIPFDRNRKGFQIGEGIGVVVLEREKGQDRHGEVLGCGLASDAAHPTSQDRSGKYYAKAIQMALAEGGVAEKVIHYVSVIGRGSVTSDLKETNGVMLALGPHAKQVPINSFIPQTGYCFAASGMFGFVFTMLQLHHKVLLPTLNTTHIDPAIDMPIICQQAMPFDGQYAVVSNDAFMGGNAAILVRKASA